MRYDIYNPTQARRVIYDGIRGERGKISIAPGETLRGVELAELIAAGFNCSPCEDKSDLILTALDENPANNGAGEPKPLPTDYVRYEAPPIDGPSENDLKDIPELTDEWFANAELHSGGKPLRKRRRKKDAAPISIGE